MLCMCVLLGAWLHRNLRLWLGKPTDEEKSYTLLCRNTGTRPLSPDTWMITNQLYQVNCPQRGTVSLPGIYRIQEMVLEDARCVVVKQLRRTKFFFMALGQPAPVQKEIADSMHEQLKAKKVEHLEQLWQREQVLEDTGISEAPFKLSLSKLGSFWHNYCVVVWNPEADGNIAQRKASCTCFWYRRRGHCPHSYWVLLEEGEDLAKRVPMPSWDEAKTQEGKVKRKAGSSESPPRSSRKKPPKRPRVQEEPAKESTAKQTESSTSAFKRRRAEAERGELPAPLRPADLEPDAELPARRAPQVLPPQKIIPWPPRKLAQKK